jgi:carbonic anhydrase
MAEKKGKNNKKPDKTIGILLVVVVGLALYSALFMSFTLPGIGGRLAELRDDVGAIVANVAGLVAPIRAEVTGVRAEVTGVRAEMAAVGDAVAVTRTQIIAQIEALEEALTPEYYLRPADLTQNPEAAWQELMVGNARFIAGATVVRDWAALRKKHAVGQWPFVSIVSCSDSRFSPEVIFDQGIGDVFSVRTAGNIVDEIALGSLEFSVNVLGAPLIVVLGHEGCGAVFSTVDALKEVLKLPPGFEPDKLMYVVGEIIPAAEEAIATGKTGIELREYATTVNVRIVAAEIIIDAFGIADAIRRGDVIVIGAKVMFDGTVTELFRVDEANIDEFIAAMVYLRDIAGQPCECCS